MKNLFALLLGIVCWSPVSGQSDVIKVKFSADFTSQIEKSIKTQDADGIVQFGIRPLDSLNKEFKVSGMERLFPYNPKFDKRHREHGLHLWYKLKVSSEEFSSQQCADIYKDCGFVIEAEAYREKKFNDGYVPNLTSGKTKRRSSFVTTTFNDPRLVEQWHYDNTGQSGGSPGADISLFDAWDIQTGSPDVVVAIIDGGLDVDHEDLAENVWINPIESAGVAGVDDDGNGYIDDINGYGFGDKTGDFSPHYHGVHVGGTVAAVNNNGIGVGGIAGGSGSGGVKMMSCAVFGSFASDGFDEAFVYAADNGAIISQNSWGYTSPGVFEQSVLDGIDYFIANAGYDEDGNQIGPMAGGIVIFAAGNDNSSADHYPGYYEPVLAVASTDHNDIRSYFSNYGSWVDIAAPGSNVLSTYPNNTYNSISGTSMACPHVSGAAALIVSEFGGVGFTPEEVLGRLVGTTDNIDAKNPSFTGLLGTGRLNAYNSLQTDSGVPPRKIEDLSAASVEGVSVTLNWTAPGANGSDGKATVYDVRYSVVPLDSAGFSSATEAIGEPIPSISGTTESFVLTGLSPTTTYYVAVKSKNFFGNTSLMSNIISFETPDIPEISIDPDTVIAILDQGDVEMQEFTISNVGKHILDFTLLEQSDFVSGLSPISGSLSEAQSQKINFSFNTGSLSPGNYFDKISASSNDPSKPIEEVVVLLHINGVPNLGLSDSIVDFQQVFLNVQDSLPLTLSNIGSDTLWINNLDVTESNFSFNPLTLPMPLLPGRDVNLYIKFSSGSIGDYSGMLAIESNDLQEPTTHVMLKAKAVEAPVVVINPDSLGESLLTGEVSSQILTIDNSTGGSELILRGSIVTTDKASFERDKSEDIINSDRLPTEYGTIPVLKNVPLEVENVPYFDGFESGNFDSWAIDGTGGLRSVVSDQVASGSYSFYYENTISINHFHGIHQDFALDNQPDYVSFKIRPGSTTEADAYFVLTSGSTEAIWFYANRSSFLYVNGDVGGDESVPYNVNTWYTIEFRDIDWEDKDFDYYVNGSLIKADISFRNPSTITGFSRAYLYNFDQSEAWWDDIQVGGGVPWLSTTLDFDTIFAGQTKSYDVTFDAAGLNGGSYGAEIAIISNDPLNTLISVPVTLDVTGAPDIAVNSDVISFGTQFIGSLVRDTLNIQNIGTDTLIVVDIGVNNSDYRLDTTSFNLAPGTSLDIIVTYEPLAVESDNAEITITSNDSDQGALVVNLTSNGILPPILEIDPDSLGVAVFTGGTIQQSLIVNNNGAHELVWNLSLKDKRNLASINSQKIIESKYLDDSAIYSKPLDVAPTWDQFAQISSTEGRVFVLDPFRSEVIEIDPATGANISSFSLPESASGGPDGLAFDGEFLYYINAFGNDIIYKMDQSGTVVDSFNFSAYAIDALGYSGEFLLALDYTTDLIYEVSVVDGSIVNTIDINQFLGGGITFAGGRNSLFVSNFSNVIYEIDYSTGQIINSISPNGSIYGLGYSDGLGILFASNVSNGRLQALNPDNGTILYELSLGSFSAIASDESSFLSWISPDLNGGTVAAGASQIIDISFDASGLNGGLYEAEIAISSNDPVNPVVRVPVAMDVTGSADISLDKDSIVFGANFVGAVVQDTLVITNEGTDSLGVLNIYSDNIDYEIDSTSFGLQPDNSMAIVVSYSPSSAGSDNTILAIVSDDLDEDTVRVHLVAEAILPPVVEVAPDSLGEHLFTGGRSMRNLLISNTGSSDLTWSLTSKLHSPPSNFSHKSSMSLSGINNSGEEVYNTIEGVFPEAVGDFSLLANSPAILTCLTIDEDAGIIYAQANNSTQFYKYDINGQSWQSLAPSPVSSGNNGGAAFRNGKVYTTYTGSSSMGIYDIAENTWTTMSIPISTGNITSDGIYIYIVQGSALYRVNESLVVESLSASPIYFDRWGGLAVYSGYLYGHGGNGGTSFARYDITSNNWEILPSVPGGAVLGSAIDPVAGKYYTYGGYSGNSWYEFDIESKSWSISTLPFSSVSDGGIVYSGRFDAGLYLIQGELGTGFARYETESAAQWLTFSQDSGTVVGGSSQSLDVTFNAEGLNGGLYYAEVLLNSNDPINPILSVLVTMDVSGAPDIDLDEDTLDFGAHFVGVVVYDTLSIANTGTDSLGVTNIFVGDPDYIIDTTAFGLLPGNSLDVLISYTPTTSGSDSTELIIVSNDLDEDTVRVALFAEALLPPDIEVIPDSLGLTLFTGETSTESLIIDNSNGSSPLTWEAKLALTQAKEVQDFGSQIGFYSERSQSNNFAELPQLIHGTSGSIGVRSEFSVLDTLNNFISNSTGMDIGGDTIYVANWSANQLSKYYIPSESIVETIGIHSQPYGLTLVEDKLVIGNSSGVLYVYNLSGTLLGTFDAPGRTYQAVSYDGNHVLLRNALATTDKLYAVDLDGTVASIYTTPSFYGHEMKWIHDDLWILGSSGKMVRFTGGLASYEAMDTINTSIGIASYSVSHTGQDLLFNAWDTKVLLIDDFEDYTSWVTIGSENGQVAPGSSVSVEVVFDATGLNGGLYQAEILINSNDPNTPLVKVPMVMDVTGAPDITIDSDTIVFGSQFLGTTTYDTLVVSNDGTDSLAVTKVMANNVDYLVDTASFGLMPGGSLNVVLAYSPTALGSDTTELWIISNDIDEDTLKVSLLAQAVLPPIASISPDSLGESLLSGGRSNKSLTISNEGPSDLHWYATVDRKMMVNNLTPQTHVLQSTFGARPNSVPVFNSTVRSTIQVISNSSGGNILFEKAKSNTWNPDALFKNLAQELSNVGYNYFTTSNLAGEDLSAFQVLVISSPSTSFSSEELAGISNFVNSGGGLFLLGEGDGSWLDRSALNQVANLFGLDFLADNSGDFFMDLSDHEVAENVDQAFVTYGSHIEGSFENIGALGSRSYAVAKSFGLGRVVAVGDCNIFDDQSFTSTLYSYDHLQLALNIVSWLSETYDWLELDVESGTIPFGTSQKVGVNFDATGLNGGLYEMEIELKTNDPNNLTLSIPASLDVTGVPAISTDKTKIDFKNELVQGALRDSVLVANPGTEDLVITDITTDHSSYTLSWSSTTLSPNSKKYLVVTYSPIVGANLDGSLTISSNDVLEPKLRIGLNIDDQNPKFTSGSEVMFLENSSLGVYQSRVDEPVTFSLGSTKDESLFTLNGDRLAFIVPPDFESPKDNDRNNAYSVDIIATDVIGNISILTLLINVIDVDDTGPAFISERVVQFQENSINPTYHIKADEPANFSIGVSKDESHFSFSGGNVLTFKSVPDFELPLDSDKDNIYKLDLFATDSSGNKSSLELSITITDVDDMAPKVISASSIELDENYLGIAYSIKSDEKATFSLGQDKDEVLFVLKGGNEIHFRSSPDFEIPNDANKDNKYELDLIASDTAGNATNFALSISVLNVDDKAPSLISTPSAAFRENALGIVYLIQADEKASYSFGISKDESLFTMEGGRELHFKNSPDYEAPLDFDKDNIYVLDIVAEDSVGNKTIFDISINVEDIDDTAPEITSSSNVSYLENGTEVAYFATANEQLEFVLGRDRDEAFFVLTNTNELSFLNPPDFEEPKDVNADNIYEVLLIAIDSVGNSSSLVVTIAVIDIQDFPLAGDINGNGVIDEQEIAGDINLDGIIGIGEIAGDINGDGLINRGENGRVNGFIEIAGDINGDGDIGEGEIAGDMNGDGNIGESEVAGDANGDGVIGAVEIAGDIDGSGDIGEAEVVGDINGDGSIGNDEVVGDGDGNGAINSDEIEGDANGDGLVNDDDQIILALDANDFNDLLISVYPNPVESILHIDFQKRAFMKASVMDVSGRVYLSYNLNNGLKKINVSALNSGLYLLKLESTDGRVETVRFIKD